MKSKIIFLSLSIAFLLHACANEDNSNASKEIKSLSEADKREFILKGREIAKETFVTLSIALKEKINEGGIQHAVDYCNIAALPLSDSIADANNVILRRVSSRYRNPANKPDSLENEVIASYLSAKEEGEKLRPQLIELDGEVHFYAPIETKGLCLSCHGEPGKFISDADYAFIKEKYPDDLAINFTTGELRGIWSIKFLDE